MAVSCGDRILEIKKGHSVSQIKVEIADTPRTRYKGLMFREYLPYGSGMFFIFEEPTQAKFWMKNTSLSLDIAFVNPVGLVTKVVYATVPYSLSVIEGGGNIQYVLEVIAGSAESLNLEKGSIVRSERIGPDALWRC